MGSIRIDKDGREDKILLVQTSFLGDVVLTIPLIAEIKRRFPRAWLAVLCKAQVQGLLEENSDIDQVIVFDKDGTQRGVTGLWIKAQDLKQYGFTVAISPHKSLKTALLLALAGIPCRIGFRQSGGWFLYHHRVRRVPALHDVERNLSILQALGIGWTECQRDLHIAVRPELRQSVERALRSYGVRSEEGKLRIGLSPGSVWPMKRWSVESYAELILALRQGYACEFLLFGAGEDESTVAKLQKLTGDCGINLVGRFTLRELPAAIETCDLFVCNDTGPMHIAVGCGIPVVAIFCATTPSLGFYPYSDRAVVVEKELHCRPCSSHGGLRCPLGTEDCIVLVRPEHVLKAIRGILDARDGESARGGSPYRPRFITL